MPYCESIDSTFINNHLHGALKLHHHGVEPRPRVTTMAVTAVGTSTSITRPYIHPRGRRAKQFFQLIYDLLITMNNTLLFDGDSEIVASNSSRRMSVVPAFSYEEVNEEHNMMF
jgi:hypothetical protein